jgi:hypothetical protein
MIFDTMSSYIEQYSAQSFLPRVNRIFASTLSSTCHFFCIEPRRLVSSKLRRHWQTASYRKCVSEHVNRRILVRHHCVWFTRPSRNDLFTIWSIASHTPSVVKQTKVPIAFSKENVRRLTAISGMLKITASFTYCQTRFFYDTIRENFFVVYCSLALQWTHKKKPTSSFIYLFNCYQEPNLYCMYNRNTTRGRT